MRFEHGETVTVTRPGGTSRYGDPLPGVDHVLDGVGFAPRYSTELTAQRSTVIVGLTMLADVGADVLPVDVITRANGKKYQVEGEPGEWISPLTGWHAGVEVALVRVTG